MTNVYNLRNYLGILGDFKLIKPGCFELKKDSPNFQDQVDYIREMGVGRSFNLTEENGGILIEDMFHEKTTFQGGTVIVFLKPNVAKD
jgi:hypothetical protein